MTPESGPMEFRNHLLPIEHLARLADGEGNRETVDLLLAGERSRRLVLLRALLDEVSRRPDVLDPLASMDEAWFVLAAVEQRDPAAVTSVILSPQFGIWISRVMRLLRGTSASAAPLWVELGYIHAAA